MRTVIFCLVLAMQEIDCSAQNKEKTAHVSWAVSYADLYLLIVKILQMMQEGEFVLAFFF